MSRIVISRKAAKRIEKIYEHPNEVFSIYRKDNGDVVWVQGEIELYNIVREIEKSA